jgi:hypothetical protein
MGSPLVGESAARPHRLLLQLTSQRPSPRAIVDDVAASPGLADSSSVVTPSVSFIAAS